MISKGVRAADFGYELQMAQMNRSLTGVDTLLAADRPAMGVRLLLAWSARWPVSGGDVTPFLPAEVADADSRAGCPRGYREDV